MGVKSSTEKWKLNLLARWKNNPKCCSVECAYQVKWCTKWGYLLHNIIIDKVGSSWRNALISDEVYSQVGEDICVKF